MTSQPRPTFLRRKLGAKLRRLREEAGMSLDDAAPKLDKKRSALHRLETGETRADVHIVRSMMDLYDQYDPGLLDETREALKPPWYRAYGVENLGYVDVETEAAQVNEFSVIALPGLLQTPEYIRALFHKHPRRTPREVDRDVAVRVVRKDRLTSRDRPLSLTAVVDEAALHREIGGREVMREQLLHLVEMSALPSVTLQIIPLKSGAHDALDGAFILVEFPDPEDLELLYIEYPTGSLHIEDQDKVRDARLLFDRLRADALSPADSAVLIEQLAVELYGHDKRGTHRGSQSTDMAKEHL